MITLRRSWLRPWRWNIWRGDTRLGYVSKQPAQFVVHDLTGEPWFTASSKQEAVRRLEALQLLLSDGV